VLLKILTSVVLLVVQYIMSSIVIVLAVVLLSPHWTDIKPFLQAQNPSCTMEQD